ncbi:MAG: hypothetical protein QME74_09120 [Candidatus Edwardsbacteria bacterium]|nr:hypothetical protein [Candidatus Edwardsbacteria bacterium]
MIVECKKLRADSLGAESKVPVKDYIDIGVLGKDDKELFLKKYIIDKPKMKFDVTMDEKPVKAGIDPWHKLIDKHSSDNLVKVEK